MIPVGFILHLLLLASSFIAVIKGASVGKENELDLQSIYERYGRNPEDTWLSVLDESYSQGRYARWQQLSTNCGSTGVDVEQLLSDWFDDGMAVLMSEDGTTDPVEVAVAPPLVNEAQEKLRESNCTASVVAEDLEKLFFSTLSPVRVANPITETFLELQEIEKFIHDLVAKYPGQAQIKQIGETENGTAIHMVIIKPKPSRTVPLNGTVTPPVVFVDSGTHAREWLSVSTSLYAIQQLLEQPSSPARQVEWRIVPVVNPDGYAYSWNTNRLWRKNRKSGSGRCQGVDLNRNFDINFAGVGASSRPCSYQYCGPSAFSEPETRAVRDAILEVGSRLKGYMALHSYSQVILLPWAYKPDEHPNLSNMTAMGEGMVKEISKARGTVFGVYDTYKNFYPGSGISMDWASSIGIPYTMTLELHDKGEHGFLYPASKINDAVTEVWKGIEYFGQEIARQSREGYFLRK
ncbi:carboxypeptidase B [Hyalella azteca]|uniref:Carboxypeptidase B n=1 Tax=Hyalella azteca TaxID=294128 RepID=A0A8B7NIQ8_HYAAZ|nr:carboxypeptidase B [Hyalella azteca]